MQWTYQSAAALRLVRTTALHVHKIRVTLRKGRDVVAIIISHGQRGRSRSRRLSADRRHLGGHQRPTGVPVTGVRVFGHRVCDPLGVPVDEQVSALHGRVAALGRGLVRPRGRPVPVAQHAVLLVVAHESVAPVARQVRRRLRRRVNRRLRAQEFGPRVSDFVFQIWAANARPFAYNTYTYI